MGTTLSRTAAAAVLLALVAARPAVPQSLTAEPYNPFDPPGSQERVGAVIQVRTVGGETRFRIDACGDTPHFFVVAASNPDQVDVMRLLVTAMTFQKEVKVYNPSGGTDINFCPGRDPLRPFGNVTVGTVRLQNPN